MTNAFTLVLKDIEQKREDIAKVLLDGRVSDFAEYKSLCGEIRGLSHAHMYVSEMVTRLEREDFDE